MADIIQTRRGTAASATANNPVLANGERGYETDTGKEKIGDGVTAWNSLSYHYDPTSSLDSSDIGVTVQGYDVDTTKNDVENTFTVAQTFNKAVDGDILAENLGDFVFTSAPKFTCTPTATIALDFAGLTSEEVGKSITIFLDNTTDFAITAGTNCTITVDSLTAISSTGKYKLVADCVSTTSVWVTIGGVA